VESTDDDIVSLSVVASVVREMLDPATKVNVSVLVSATKLDWPEIAIDRKVLIPDAGFITEMVGVCPDDTAMPDPARMP